MLDTYLMIVLLLTLYIITTNNFPKLQIHNLISTVNALLDLCILLNNAYQIHLDGKQLIFIYYVNRFFVLIIITHVF